MFIFLLVALLAVCGVEAMTITVQEPVVVGVPTTVTWSNGDGISIIAGFLMRLRKADATDGTLLSNSLFDADGSFPVTVQESGTFVIEALTPIGTILPGTARALGSSASFLVNAAVPPSSAPVSNTSIIPSTSSVPVPDSSASFFSSSEPPPSTSITTPFSQESTTTPTPSPETLLQESTIQESESSTDSPTGLLIQTTSDPSTQAPLFTPTTEGATSTVESSSASTETGAPSRASGLSATRISVIAGSIGGACVLLIVIWLIKRKLKRQRINDTVYPFVSRQRSHEEPTWASSFSWGDRERPVASRPDLESALSFLPEHVEAPSAAEMEEKGGYLAGPRLHIDTSMTSVTPANVRLDEHSGSSGTPYLSPSSSSHLYTSYGHEERQSPYSGYLPSQPEMSHSRMPPQPQPQYSQQSHPHSDEMTVESARQVAPTRRRLPATANEPPVARTVQTKAEMARSRRYVDDVYAVDEEPEQEEPLPLYMPRSPSRTIPRV